MQKLQQGRKMKNQIEEGFLNSVLALCEAVGIKICELKGVKPPRSLTKSKRKLPARRQPRRRAHIKNDTYT